LIASSALVLVGVTPAKAEQPVSIAIIDSGFDTSQISGNVIEEVCAVATSRCNNSSNIHVGQGAAGSTVRINPRNLNDWNHGTQMANLILQENPNANLILVRNSKLYGGTVLPGTERDTLVALRWVLDNAEKYNIVAVSMSRGSNSYISSNREINTLNASIRATTTTLNHIKTRPVVNQRMLATFEKRLLDLQNSLNALGRIACPVTDDFYNMVGSLKSNNVATIVATGNDANKSYVDYPACIDDVVAVAASDAPLQLTRSSNISYNTDFIANGLTTSEATARLAGRWSLVYNGSYNSTYNLIVSSGTASPSWPAIFVP
jgi:hypothetical protein